MKNKLQFGTLSGFSKFLLHHYGNKITTTVENLKQLSLQIRQYKETNPLVHRYILGYNIQDAPLPADFLNIQRQFKLDFIKLRHDIDKANALLLSDVKLSAYAKNQLNIIITKAEEYRLELGEQKNKQESHRDLARTMQTYRDFGEAIRLTNIRDGGRDKAVTLIRHTYQKKCLPQNLNKLSKSNLIRCLLRQYPTFWKLMDICEININKFFIVDLPDGPLSFGINWQVVLSILFNFMPSGILGPWSPPLSVPGSREVNLDNPPQLRRAPHPRDSQWPNITSGSDIPDLYAGHDLPLYFADNICLQIINVLFPYYRYIIPGHVGGGPADPRNNGYAYISYLIGRGTYPLHLRQILYLIVQELSSLPDATPCPPQVLQGLTPIEHNSRMVQFRMWRNRWIIGAWHNVVSNTNYIMRNPVNGQNLPTAYERIFYYAYFTPVEIVGVLKVLTKWQLGYLITV